MIEAPRDFIIIKRHYVDKKNDSKIIFPETYGVKENHMDYYCEVIAIGDECPLKNDIKIGDKLICQRNEGIKITTDGEYWSLKPKYIEAKIC